jgi:hypothetical protein
MEQTRQSLWTPIVAPIVWAAHFTVCYAWLALACGRFANIAGFDSARTGVAVLTVIASVVIAGCFAFGFHRHGRRFPDQPNDDGTPEDRTRFMAFTTMLLAGLSLVATLYVGLAALAVGRCL